MKGLGGMRGRRRLCSTLAARTLRSEKKSQKTLNLDESSYRILERFPNELSGESDHVAYKYSKVSSGTQSFRNPIEPLKWFPRGGVTKSMSFCVFVYYEDRVTWFPKGDVTRSMSIVCSWKRNAKTSL